MHTLTAPHFRELTSVEARALLASTNVGRVAFSFHDKVDITPINFVSDGEWIFGRTSAGAKLGTLLHRPWCAFEVDDIHGLFEWSSVVAKGTFYVLDPETGSADTYRRAERLLSALVPGIFTARDPVPQRDILFGIYIHELTGRSAG